MKTTPDCPSTWTVLFGVSAEPDPVPRRPPGGMPRPWLAYRRPGGNRRAAIPLKAPLATKEERPGGFQ